MSYILDDRSIATPPYSGPKVDEVVETSAEQVAANIPYLFNGEKSQGATDTMMTKILSLFGIKGRFVTIDGRPVFMGGPSQGAGGTSGGGVSQSIPSLASELAKSAAQVEPGITEIVTDVVEDGDGTMEGLDFRLKTQESIESKIRRDADEENISPTEAASGVTDLIRYTAVFESEDLVANSAKLQAELAENGWTQYDEKFRNYFVPPPPDRPYRGYNTVYQNKAGQTFELQFHTPQSLAIKGQVHTLYEAAREMAKGPERTALYRQMNNLWSDFQSPAGWENIVGIRME